MIYLGKSGEREDWEQDGKKYQFAWVRGEEGYAYGWLSKRALRLDNSSMLSDERGEWIESFRPTSYKPLRKKR